MSNTSYSIGSGKSKELQHPKDGWILQQMKAKEPIPGIMIEEGVDTLRFASKISKIASTIGDFNIKRSYHRKGDNTFAFFYSIHGSFEHATVSQIELVKELLLSKFTDDFESIFFVSEPTLTHSIQAKISLQHSAVYVYFEVKFGKEWTPGEDFWEV